MSSSIFARVSPEEIEKLYQSWNNDPLSVDPLWGAYFEGYALGSLKEGYPSSTEANPSEPPPDYILVKGAANGNGPVSPSYLFEPLVDANTINQLEAAEETSGDTQMILDEESLDWRGRVSYLIDSYRFLGHQMAAFNPLDDRPPSMAALSYKVFGFTKKDLDRPVNLRAYKQGQHATLRHIIDDLKKAYCGSIGFEYMHIDNLAIRAWIEKRIMNRVDGVDYGKETRIECLRQLHQAENFEEFLGKKFLGEKRFSLEGGEGLIVMLKALVQACPSSGVSHIEMGMAHRGRLNVLANILNKSLKTLLYEFTAGYLPDNPSGGSDVKYHLGYETVLKFSDGDVKVNLSANPSHLEAVDPVVEGRARAVQRDLVDANRTIVLPLLIHGDAAFAGQGLVAEVFNLSQLQGYKTGGTIHIIVNNQIGFTTKPEDSRSSRYATDVAKTAQAPILHIHGEKPEDIIWATLFALEFRQTFGIDIVLDMYCYRRLGHNETDQASFTNPMLMGRIGKKPTTATLYGRELQERGEITEEQLQELQKEQWKAMEAQFEKLKNLSPHNRPTEESTPAAILQQTYSFETVQTGISVDTYHTVASALTTVPEGFVIHPTLEKRFMARRKETFASMGDLDWGMAEALAWGSMVKEGTPVRITGQDSQRGTFSHRHAVLHDYTKIGTYMPLSHVCEGQAPFRVFNSALSEASVLGFEYGYSLSSPDSLVMWEAQFGDFANGAQVIVDQFIASAETKWHQFSSMVLLLPHGYEAGGSEHSSSRLERYLQLCAEDNMLVMNLTTPAQYFHALRKQIKQRFNKPMVLMSPKSLLSHPMAVSPSKDILDNSSFQEILPDPDPLEPTKVTKVIFCSGKVFYDLIQHRFENEIDDTLIIRIEQIYPLYDDLLTYMLAPYPHIKDFCWCQEEPENMGAWSHLRSRLGRIFATSFRYAGRPMMACPAEGAKALHYAAQKRLIAAAFGNRSRFMK